MTIAELYESRKDDPRWNTSYPLNPSDWAAYRVSGSLPFKDESSLSFYIHIPFCKQLCSFCEYTRMLCPDENIQRRYIEVVANDIRQFKSQYNDFTLLGFDIGGGTPTALSTSCFAYLMDVYDDAIAGLTLSETFEPSIEATFSTLSEEKLDRLVKSGIRRLSLGVQSSYKSVLRKYRRDTMIETEMKEWLEKVWNAGVEKINLDLMYGLEGQDFETIDNDLRLISELRPQQVTLYELRTNMIPDKLIPDKETLFGQYSRYYEGFIKMGYDARFGQNTFTKYAKDFGISSYLRERMLNGASYKGFGLSAQSMNTYGLSYNIGKAASINQSILSTNSYQEEYTYFLPQKELAAKYLAISAYKGSFSIEKLQEFGIEKSSIQSILDFCLSEALLCYNGSNRLAVTPKGFKYYGALFSLFWNQQQ